MKLETIRYYERAGLLPPSPRTASGYREYRSDHLQRLVFQRRSRQRGFSIKQAQCLLVESAQAQKGPAQQWIERFGRRYSPAVLFAAVFTATVPWLLGMPASEWVHRAVAAVQHYSQHPLARAIVQAAETRRLALRSAHNFSSLTGACAEAIIDGTTWTVGSPALFAARSLPLRELEDRIAVLQDAGKTVVLAQCEGQLRGLLALQDQPRPEAREVIARLHTLGQRTVMLTGDNRRTAEAIARELGIDDVRSDLKSDAKVEVVRQLYREHGPVLMVGDGVNDSPALACASCGIAMGAGGTDAALEAADIALMKDDLRKVVEALVRGRKARTVSRQNIEFSVAVLAIMISLAVGGLIGVALAVLVHETAELLAVANGLRAGAI